MNIGARNYSISFAEQKPFRLRNVSKGDVSIVNYSRRRDIVEDRQLNSVTSAMRIAVTS